MKKALAALCCVALTTLTGCGPPPTQPKPPAVLVPGTAPASTLFILSGAITDRDGHPIANAQVRVPGKVVATDAAGLYSVAVQQGTNEVTVSRDGYEEDWRRVVVFSDTRRDFVLSTIIRITAGDTATVTLSPKDPSYEFRVDIYDDDVVCESPCRIVRFAAPVGQIGTVSITAGARDRAHRLIGYYYSGGFHQVPFTTQFSLSQFVGGGGDIVLWVGFVGGPGPGADLRIDFTTSFRPR